MNDRDPVWNADPVSRILPNDRQDKINSARDTTRAKLAKAMSLLERAEEAEIVAPDKDWWRDLYLLTGRHAVLTDEGWIPGAEKHLVSPDNIKDEVNAPARKDADG